MTHPDLQQRLQDISTEMVSLIEKYNVVADHPLDIIPSAKKQITDPADYVRFIELSLEGRLIGETYTHAENAQNTKPH